MGGKGRERRGAREGKEREGKRGEIFGSLLFHISLRVMKLISGFFPHIALESWLSIVLILHFILKLYPALFQVE